MTDSRRLCASPCHNRRPVNRRLRAIAVLAFALMSASCATTTPHVPAVTELTIDQKVGQLFSVDGHGLFMNESSPAYQRLLGLVRDRHAGGVIWFVSNVYETALLTRHLQEAAKIPLLVSADLESGVGMRFLDTTFWAPAMAVAATGDPSLAEREGRMVAVEARTLGINHILAPVADVNVNPDNTVINARSYGEDPKEVGRFVAAFIKGVQSEGLLATAKHFPGHGDTHVDSHRSLPVLDVTRERLDTVELVPFRAAIEAGVGSVMMGHLSVPVLDPTPSPIRTDGVRENRYAHDNEAPDNASLPATLSKPMIEGLLRRDLGFKGLIVSDAFDMGGLTEHFDAGEAAIRAIEAGEDQILLSPNPEGAMDAVKEAVKSGRLPMARVDDAVARILEAKRRVPHKVATPDEIFHQIDSPASRELSAEIATRALTLVREEANALPLRRDARILIVSVTDFVEAVNPLAEFDREVRARIQGPVRSFSMDSRSTDADLENLVAAAADADVVLFGLAIRARSGAGRLALPAAAKQSIERLATTKARPIVISFGTPYLLRELPSVQTYLCAYGPQPVLQTAAARALFGEKPISGHLPVTIPGLYARGHGIARK